MKSSSAPKRDVDGFKADSGPGYYFVLGLERNATQQGVEAVYLRALRCAKTWLGRLVGTLTADARARAGRVQHATQSDRPSRMRQLPQGTRQSALSHSAV